MIEANIWVHSDNVQEFFKNESEDFKIVNFAKPGGGMCYFNIEITEERYTFLKLKYGDSIDIR